MNVEIKERKFRARWTWECVSCMKNAYFGEHNECAEPRFCVSHNPEGLTGEKLQAVFRWWHQQSLNSSTPD